MTTGVSGVPRHEERVVGDAEFPARRRKPVTVLTPVTGSQVGVAGFEPTAPRTQSECATKLRHTPS